MVGSHLEVVAGGTQDPAAESQKSSLFPWDNAGVSSSAGFNFGIADETPNISSDVGGRLLHHSRSVSRREASLARSLVGSPVPFSFQNEGALSDDFQFRGAKPENIRIVKYLRADQSRRREVPWLR